MTEFLLVSGLMWCLLAGLYALAEGAAFVAFEFVAAARRRWPLPARRKAVERLFGRVGWTAGRS